MIFILVFAIIVAILFSRSAKQHGQPSVKWGGIGFGGGIASYLILSVVGALIKTYIFNWMYYIDGPGYVIFPLSALVMFLVYRKWLRRPEHEKSVVEPE